MSSQTVLLLAMGMSAYVGLLHVWYVRRPSEPHRWVVLWSLAALAFQSARLVQFQTEDPDVAVMAARSYAAVAPILIGSLCGYACALTRQKTPRRQVFAFLTANAALSIVVLSTDWFISGAISPQYDWFGDPFIGVQGRPTLLVLPAYMGWAFWWALRQIQRSPEHSPAERGALMAGFSLYAVMGLASVGSSLGWLDMPGTAEFGPVVLGVALSCQLVLRQRRLEESLHSLVEARTAELAVSEARHRELIENAPIGIFACDAEGRVTVRNPRLHVIMGKPDGVEDPLGRGAAAAMRRCLTRGELIQGEVRYTSRWGRTADLRVVLAPLRGENGAVTGAFGLVEDVSEQRILEEGLRRSQKLQAVGQLAAGIAHEINNPMAYARTNLAVLREEWQALKKALGSVADATDLTDRFAECEVLIDESLEGIERTVAIARDMRELAHCGQERHTPVDLNAVVEGCVRVAGVNRKGPAAVAERYAQVAPVWGSAGQLRQVFLNLLVNALDAVGDAGNVRVETTTDAERAIVRVIDDGAGILPEYRDRLFDPFFTTKPAGEGTGLGLYISEQIVRGHHGEIRVSSTPGQGACFEVRLPFAPATKDEAETS